MTTGQALIDRHKIVLLIREQYGRMRHVLARHNHLAGINAVESVETALEGLAPETLALGPVQWLIATTLQVLQGIEHIDINIARTDYAASILAFFQRMKIEVQPVLEERVYDLI